MLQPRCLHEKRHCDPQDHIQILEAQFRGNQATFLLGLDLCKLDNSSLQQNTNKRVHDSCFQVSVEIILI